MNLNDFKSILPKLQSQVAPQRVISLKKTDIPYAIGVDFDKDTRNWYVYENDERSQLTILYRKDREEEIVDVFLRVIQHEIKRYKKYLEWMEKNKD